MRSINFDDGFKSFCINGDENRVIRFNPGDLNMRVRVEEAQKRIRKWEGSLKAIELNPDGTLVVEDEEESAELRGFEDVLRRELNYVFNADVYDTIFSGQSPLCTVGKEKMFLFEAVLQSVTPIIEEEIEAFSSASQARVEKYTEGYRK
ncbi:hypothetical protein K5I21_04980 [[Clostridium] symbiosum]|uniref:Uncharacterized protein n=2 Tax=Clostridium symbiosum TaxID=1512 RepID=A0AAW5EZX0_CLOSY|nr:hypothetical protein [[Clostridium] symbiosum]MCK0085232.1 hypothetical protein [[Clostridium] symbiosum]